MSGAAGGGGGDVSSKQDRKKSAHWSDQDTEILVDLLLRYKDTGRTPDNGFKPEVWREASGLLQRNNPIGGPKTPEACKSRWQRIQRDYKAAKEMETMPGVTWDRTTNRLSASSDAWENAEKQLEPYKYQRIHLPCFDAIALLCQGEAIRARPRGRTRPSLASSDSSSMMSLSLSSTTGHGSVSALSGQMNGTSINGHGHSTPVDSHSLLTNGQQMQMVADSMHGHAMAQHMANSGLISWDGGDEDGEGEFDASFGMGDTSQHHFVMPQAQKRLPFDPSMMPGPSTTTTTTINMSNRPSPNKKPRTSQTGHPRQALPGQPTNQATTTQHLGHPYHVALSQPHSPEFTVSTSSTSLLDPMLHGSPSNAPLAQMTVTGQAPPPQILQPSPMFATPSRGSPMSDEIRVAGLSEAQRRTQAITNLQEETELADEDLVDIVNEFTNNIAQADAYLALKREPLRKLFLAKLIKRRKK